MTSLRTRIAMLVVVAIVGVVALATITAVTIIGPPGHGPRIEAVLEQIEMLVKTGAARRGPMDRDDGMVFHANPPEGERDKETAQRLEEALQDRGLRVPIVVLRHKPGTPMVASIKLEDKGWVMIPILPFPPRPHDGWTVLLGWMMLIVAGTTGIALFLAERMTKPLTLIESTIESVGLDGLLPRLPETGSGEIRATAKALNRLSERLQVSMESRMRLVAAAGHDLRTPMTRMRLRTEFLENDEERAAWLHDLDELEHIANSAIQLVREEVGGAPPDAIDLDEMVFSLVDDLKKLGHCVDLVGLEPVQIKAGRLALTRALRNLMINAATHGGGAKVRLSVRDQQAEIIITDDGPGIPPENMAHVFEPFFRVDPARRQPIPGAGLGLAIAKEIINRYHGDIFLENRVPTGLQQRIVFPVVG